MGTLFISWHKDDFHQRGMVPIDASVIKKTQVTTTATASTLSAAAPTGVKYAEVWADEAIHIAWNGTAPVAASGSLTGAYRTIPANTLVPIYPIYDGSKVAGRDVS